MSEDSGAAGLAALSVCESLLLSLTENKIIDEAEAKAILADAAAAHRGAVPWPMATPATTPRPPRCSRRSCGDGNAVRRARPSPASGGDGADPQAT